MPSEKDKKIDELKLFPSDLASKEKSIWENPSIDLGAYRMRSGRSTNELVPHFLYRPHRIQEIYTRENAIPSLKEEFVRTCRFSGDEGNGAEE